MSVIRRPTLEELMVQPALHDQKTWFPATIIEFLHQAKLLAIGEDDITATAWQQDANVIIDVLAHISPNHDDRYAQTLLRLTFNGHVVCFFAVAGKWNDEATVKVVNPEAFTQLNAYLTATFSKPLVIDEKPLYHFISDALLAAVPLSQPAKERRDCTYDAI